MVTKGRARQDLSGAWQLVLDQGRPGVHHDWVKGEWPEEDSDCVQVPALWNVTHPDAEGVGYYRKVFTIPSDWYDKVIRLHFGGVSYRCDVWLNGIYVGGHEGAYTPFRFEVTSMAKVGSENQLVVRVAALSRTEDVDGMVLVQSPASKQSWYYTHGGIWDDVYLEALPTLSCRAVSVEPDLYRETVLVEAALTNAAVESLPVDLQLQIVGPDGSLAATEGSMITVPPGTIRPTYLIPLPRPTLWDTQNPNLYRLEILLSEQGAQTDSLGTRFGVREFTARQGQFFLNGELIYLRGLLLQPNYPITLVAPPTREMLVREIQLAKAGGFNLIRLHIRPAPPDYLDVADEMGMLIYAESSLAWIRDSPRLLEHGRRELREMIERDRNHPSVVFWGINNENPAANAINSDTLIRHVRALDPTRVILDNSGGSMAIDQDFGWLDRATIVPSRSTERQRTQDIHIYIGAPITPPVYEWMRTLGTGDLAPDISEHDFGSKALIAEWNRELRSYQGHVFVSELGCGGMADLDQVVAGFGDHGHLRDAQEMRAFRDSLYEGFEARGLDHVFGSVPSLINATQAAQAAGLRRQIEALMVNPRVSGYIVTQLNDVAWEFHAGILDHWRNPKPVYEALTRLNQAHCLVLNSPAPVVTCGEEVGVNLTLVSRGPLQGEAQIRVTVTDPAGIETAMRGQKAPLGTGIKEFTPLRVKVREIPGAYKVTAQLIQNDEGLAESDEAILGLPEVNFKDLADVITWEGERKVDTQGDLKLDMSKVLLVADPTSLLERDWEGLLDAVEVGQVAIIGPMTTRDKIPLRRLNSRGVNTELHLGIGNWMGCFHWIPESELFAGLPAGGLAGEPYAEVLPWYVMSELGGKVFAGSIRNTQTRKEPPAILWYSDIEALSFGKGALLFCQYRIFDKAATNPLAAKMVSNLVRLAESYRCTD